MGPSLSKSAVTGDAGAGSAVVGRALAATSGATAATDDGGAMTGTAAPVRAVGCGSRPISRGRGFSTRRELLFELAMAIADRCGFGGCAFAAGNIGPGAFGANCALRTSVVRSAACCCTAGGGIGVRTFASPVSDSDGTGADEEGGDGTWSILTTSIPPTK